MPRFDWKRGALAALLCLPLSGAASSNVSPDRSEAWSANAGWMNWRPELIDGVQVCRFICLGYIYSANLGWISLGNGLPENGIQYRNTSASDFGVNVDRTGNLRGLAYGANVGWINFEDSG